MRIAVASDIHGNLTALEAVVADLRSVRPDVVLHGGDLAHGGPRPAEVVDRLSELGWEGVCGNTDEMLWAPESLLDFAARAPSMAKLFEMIEEMRVWTREQMGEERTLWLKSVPMVRRLGDVALMHASPKDTWRGPGRDASEGELQRVFGELNASVVVYGHIHQPYVKEMERWTVANSGSVSLSYDGDWRASYAVVEGTKVEIRRVEYSVEDEVEAIRRSGMPHGDWVGTCLRAGKFVPPGPSSAD